MAEKNEFSTFSLLFKEIGRNKVKLECGDYSYNLKSPSYRSKELVPQTLFSCVYAREKASVGC